jgi:hypothetical protein
MIKQEFRIMFNLPIPVLNRELASDQQKAKADLPHCTIVKILKDFEDHNKLNQGIIRPTVKL